MDSRTEHRGACLCGAVSVIAKPKTDKVVLCHCKMCRQWGGGPLFAPECEQAVTFEGAEHIARSQPSPFPARGFCTPTGPPHHIR